MRNRLGALVTLFPIALVLAFSFATAEARPGGGQSYSGGSSSSSGSGYSSSSSYDYDSGDDGDGEELPQWAAIIVVVSMGSFCVIGLIGFRKQNSQSQFTSGVVTPRARGGTRLGNIRQIDEDFSEVVLGDFVFVFGLAAKAYAARGPALTALAPYLSPTARARIERFGPMATNLHVVVGSITDTKVELPNPQAPSGECTRVTLRLQLNLRNESMNMFVEDRWDLVRQGSVKSRPPQAIQSFNCPNCGAVFESSNEQSCGHCGEVVAQGRFDWFVAKIWNESFETRMDGLTSYSEEVGTDWKTLLDPHLAHWSEELAIADPAFNFDAFLARVKMIYGVLNSSWNDQDLSQVRPYVGDGLFAYLAHGLAPYQQQGLTNRMEEAEVMGQELAKVVRDKYYDAITIRLWAQAKDYVVRTKDGAYKGGNTLTKRSYSEYWTFIRGSGVKGPSKAEPRCPSCGAEPKIGMSGNCEFCNAHITAGEFDWVLSKIEQDEAYAG